MACGIAVGGYAAGNTINYCILSIGSSKSSIIQHPLASRAHVTRDDMERACCSEGRLHTRAGGGVSMLGQYLAEAAPLPEVGRWISCEFVRTFLVYELDRCRV